MIDHVGVHGRPERAHFAEIGHFQAAVAEIQVSNEFQERCVLLFADSTRVGVHLEHVLVVDVHGEKVRIGEFRLAVAAFGVDVFEWRVLLQLMFETIRRIIKVLTEMSN